MALVEDTLQTLEDPSKYYPIAIRSLMRVVEGDLTLADRVRIKNIAIESYHFALNLARKNPESGLCLNYILDTHLNEMALWKLEEFGYDLKKPERGRHVQMKLPNYYSSRKKSSNKIPRKIDIKKAIKNGFILAEGGILIKW